jgi:lysophospholipase
MAEAEMTPGQLDVLRESLAPYPNGASDNSLYRHYLDLYGLDFAARYAGLSCRAGLVCSGRFQLMTHVWTLPDARANLLLVHGYFDHTGIYDKLIDYGLSRRCNVVMFDLPGHGLSSGERAAIDDFHDYGEAVASVLGAVTLPALPLHVVAQSTGCAALMAFARRHDWPFERAVFLAPLVRPAGWLGVRLGHSLLSPFTETLQRKFNANSSDTDFLQFVRRDPLQCHRVSLRWIGALKRWLGGLPLADLGVGPVLVLQGDRDGTVGWRYNMKAIAKLFPGSRIEYLPGAGHQLANESAVIRSRYAASIDAWLFA